MSAETDRPSSPPTLSDLPDDELQAYAADLGLDLDQGVPRGELLRLIRQRQELLLDMSREAMLEVVIWGRRPVRKSAGKEALARQIARVHRVRFDGLSDRGLVVLARLRGLEAGTDERRDAVERRLKKAEGLRARLRRARRGIVASLLTKIVAPASPEEYRFLPEDQSAGGGSFREQVQDDGVVGGIARKLRGVADDYVREKLDEIEVRIDRKLDEIDRRLGEWRDREVANRLKILKITLIVTVLVALISLGYDMLSGPTGGDKPATLPGQPTEVSAAPPAQRDAVEGAETNHVRGVQPTGG